MVIEAGQQLLHYRLIEKIGEGGMGVVWKAEDTKLHRHVALKVLPEAMAADPDRRVRFEREARAVAALNHPNIVTLHSVEEVDTSTGTVRFITMELVDGRSLSALLPRDGFPLDRALEIAIPLADAVSTAHRAGITHRDLKPDNVMVDAQGRLRVLDFGLAKLHDPAPTTKQDAQTATVTSDTAEGRILGTVAYMSPEQAEGKEVDARSDVFSLGTILYEMLTGKRPFHGETTMSAISSILKDEPSSVTEVKPGLPRHTARILRRCLAKDPERRCQTAIDLRNELEELKAEIASGEYQVDRAAPAQRRSLVPFSVAAVLGLAVGWIGAVAWRGGDTPPPIEYEQRPVTASTAWDQGGTWSPDGKFIAFDRMEAGNLDIFIKPVDGGAEVARITDPGDQGAPRWSPDGELLAYVSNDLGSPVYLVPPEGGTPKQLIETGTSALEGNPNHVLGDRPWSVDGKSLLVARSVDNGKFAIYRVDRESRAVEQLTDPPAGVNDTMATYSFDHRWILFRRGSSGAFGKMSLMVMPAEGGEPELLHEEVDLESIAWRPDNRRVVFQRGTTLNEIDVVTKQTRQLVSLTKRIQGISISSGGRIMYSDFWHYQFLYEVDLESGERRQITSHAQGNGGARFSPDGRTIAYTSNRTDNHEVWLHHLDGRQETQLTGDGRGYITPEWSPDGKRLVFKSELEDGTQRMFVANVDGAGGVRQLADQRVGGRMGINSVRRTRWSPDGEIIAFPVDGDAGPELWTIHPDGSDALKRLDGAREFDWYGDSRRAIVTRPRGSETELTAVDLETGDERVLFVGALQEIDVAPDGSGVAFCFGRGHFSMGLAVLKLDPPSEPGGLPTAVGEPEYVVPTEGNWHVHNGGWSPDSKRIVYVHDEDYGDIYELVEKR
jgi:Tol biopolymer transport system component/tRNA A-37 threonylcarbamoyl transferase component Bud32